MYVCVCVYVCVRVGVGEWVFEQTAVCVLACLSASQSVPSQKLERCPCLGCLAHVERRLQEDWGGGGEGGSVVVLSQLKLNPQIYHPYG